MAEFIPFIKRLKTKFTGEFYLIFDWAGTSIKKSNFEIVVENSERKETNAIKDVFGNYAITCQSSLLKNLTEAEKANIFIRDAVNLRESNKIEYRSVNTKRKLTSDLNDDENAKRRRIVTYNLTLYAAMRQAKIIITNKHSKEDTKWRKLARLVNDYSFQHNSLQTCFHDAMSSEDPLVVAIITELLQPEYNYYLSTIKSRRRQNLLHYACDLKKLEYIKLLLSRHTLLCEQDVLGNTPLHVAINRKDVQCLSAICDIFLNCPQSLRNVFVRLMSAHNCANYTPLHLAILADNIELVVFILNFSKTIFDFDVTSIQVLGSNKTAFDLILSDKMYKAFTVCCPNVENNYNYQLSKNR